MRKANQSGKRLSDITHGALRVLRKTGDAPDHFARSVKFAQENNISWNEIVEANHQAKQSRGWKDLAVEKTVSSKGVVRRKNINYGRDATSKLVPAMAGHPGPLFSLNRLLGLSEINQGLVEIQSGDIPFDGIPVVVHLPQVNQVIETTLVPRFRFGKGMRRAEPLMRAMSGKKRMVLVELGSDSDKPQLQITFY